MGIRYGFGRHETDPVILKIWKRKFDKLTDPDKRFFHDVIPSILLFAWIDTITLKSIPDIINRLCSLQPGMYNQALDHAKLNTGSDSMTLEVYLQRFCGYYANTGCRSRSQLANGDETIKKRLSANEHYDAYDYSRSIPLDECLLEEASTVELPLLINHRWDSPEAEQLYKQRMENLI